MRRLSSAIIALGAVALTSAAHADMRNCAIDYATFEDEVHHFDFEVCPSGFPGEDAGFCRGALIGNDMHVYFFAYDDANDRSCLAQHQEVDIDYYMAKAK
tara:strand:- start:2124 stop:2423 length:300 start_codon:yes stop_codon:yes gene_type:complete